MLRIQPIKIVLPQVSSRDKATIKAAKITSIAALIAVIIGSLISFSGSITAAIIPLMFSQQSKIVQDCSNKIGNWQQTARENGWIPKSECAWESIPGGGTDKNGKKVKVLIHLLAGEYKWACGSSSKIELGDAPADLTTHIKSLVISPEADVLVAIGMASVEGGFDSQAKLSKDRTDMLVTIIKRELENNKSVHGLSLGRFKDEKTKSECTLTADQRRVVVIEVIDQDENIDYESAVYDALVNANLKTQIPFNVMNYKNRDYYDYVISR
jgi:hypothetical protein